MKYLISIVIPAYNEADNINALLAVLHPVLQETGHNYEVIFINDGSTDNTLEMLKELATTDPHIFYIDLSRNFGHQLALKAGYDHANGDCVIAMDCDLQHPPSLIPTMLEKWMAGYEVVYTIREEDPKQARAKRKTSSLFYSFLRGLSDIQLESGAADFRLLDRKVVEVFKTFNENEPFIRGLIKWIGFKQYSIRYMPGERFAGESKYTIKKMMRLALHGITSFSIKPLYTAIYLGFCFSLLSLLYVPYVIYAFYSGHEVAGWASVIMTVVFFGGLQLIILGIIGIYVGKMFMQSKNRPNYIIGNTNLKNI